MLGDHARAAEERAKLILDFRNGNGIAVEGWAHVHVEDSLTSTPRIYVVLPGGSMMEVGGDADQLTLRKRGDFIAAAINSKLSPLPPKAEPHQVDA